MSYFLKSGSGCTEGERKAWGLITVWLEYGCSRAFLTGSALSLSRSLLLVPYANDFGTTPSELLAKKPKMNASASLHL